MSQVSKSLLQPVGIVLRLPEVDSRALSQMPLCPESPVCLCGLGLVSHFVPFIFFLYLGGDSRRIRSSRSSSIMVGDKPGLCETLI